MNYYQYKEAERDKVKGIHYWANKCRKIQKTLEYNSNPKATVRHHLRDTEEQRKYNDEHYEYFGFNQDGTFEYGKYIIFVTKEEHNEIHQCSEETKNKRSKSLEGHLVSSETRKKISDSKVGIPRSKETKDKLSLSLKIFWENVSDEWYNEFCSTCRNISDETRKKLSERFISDETKNAISNSIKELWMNDSYRSKQIESHIGYTPTEETRKKLSESLKGRESPMKGKHHSEETKKKLSEIGTGRIVSEETCKKISNALKGSHHRPSPFAGRHFTEEQLDLIRSKRREASEKYKEYKLNGGELSWNEFCKQLKLNNNNH